MAARNGKSDIARRYRDKYGLEMSSKALAKIMHKENNLKFTNPEDARLWLRYIEGKHGVRNRKSIKKDSKYFKEEARPYNPYKLPEPEIDENKPFLLPASFNNFILAGDFHIPNHRNIPITTMLNYAEKNNITQLFINGDLLDNTPFTKWINKPVRAGDVKEWFEMTKAMLISFKNHFNEIYWLEGNHDWWYKRWLMTKAEELYGDPYYELSQRLGLDKIGVTFINQERLVKAGHLNITHGHILLRGGGTYANAARMLYMKTKKNTICSHVHVESSHTEPDLNDEVTTTWTTGCMCTLSPDYQPFGGKSCWGFAHIKTFDKGIFNVSNFRINKNGEIL